MGRRVWGRASVSYAFGLSLVFLGLAAAIILFVVIAFWPYTSWSVDWFIFSLYAACVTYTGSGLLLWWFRPTNRLGPLMVAVGFIWLLVGIDTLPNRAPQIVGLVVAYSVIAGALHILLAFPSGRLRSNWARAAMALAWFTGLILAIPQYLYLPGSPLSIGTDRGVVDAWHNAQLWTIAIPVSIVTITILVGRIRATAPALRWVLWPLYAYGVVTIFAMPVFYDLLAPRLGWQLTTVEGLQTYTLALLPVFFAAAALSGVFGRTGQVDELAAWLSRTRGSERELERMLVDTLGDDSVRLLFWLDDAGRYVGAEGSPVGPLDEAGRGLEQIRVTGRLVGAIDYDAELISDPAPVQAAAQVVALSVDRERLLADLRASEEALRQSRARIVEAGDLERRRLARNLHDGIQGKLVMLAIQARSIADDPRTSETVRADAMDLWRHIDDVTTELREQVHAVMPAALIERGLVAAIEDLVDRMPVRTTVSAGAAAGALPPAVQTTAYFIVAEALTNAVKYAQADAVQVVLTERNERLLISIVDDGVGGAAPAGGSGLRGLADRAEALGGRLVIESAPGAGTKLEVDLPLTPADADVPA